MAENYRPISLTSILCKTLEHIVSHSIHQHLEDKDILTNAQHGFRKRRSCETQLITVIQDLASNIDKGTQTDVILLDFSKAFDKVPHARLLHKLEYYGIKGNIHSWIRSFLSDRTQQVVIDGVQSEDTSVDSGVPQGSVLGPLLFLLFINDMPEVISSDSKLKLFADDSILYRKINTKEDCKALQQDLQKLQDWESDWLMSFHPGKCQVLNVTRKRSPIHFSYSIHGVILQIVDSAKYLGLNLTNSLSWNDHIDVIVKKANKSRSFLQRNLNSCPKVGKNYCYKTLVRPIVEYGSVIWDPYTQDNIHKLEMVQRRSARFTTGKYQFQESVSQMMEELKWPSLETRRKEAKTTMMYKIINKIVDCDFSFTPASHSLRGHSQKLIIPYAKSQTFQKSFLPDGIRMWNGLSQNTVASSSVEEFKRMVQLHEKL